MINSPRRMQLFPRQLPSATGVASSIDGFRRLQVLVSTGYVQHGTLQRRKEALPVFHLLRPFSSGKERSGATMPLSANLDWGGLRPR